MENKRSTIRGYIIPAYHVRPKLREIADLLISNADKCGNLGMNGIPGIAIFLIYYSEYLHQPACRKFAETMLAGAGITLHRDSPIGYADGLAGLGCALLHLSEKGFLTLSAGYFVQLDHLVYDRRQGQNNVFLNSLTGITGSGKYYIDRLRCDKLLTPESYAFNTKALAGIIDDLDPPYASYSEIIHAIHILGEAYSFNRDDLKAKDYLDYSLDKLETMKYEDEFFDNKFQTYDELKFSLALLAISQLSGDPQYGTRKPEGPESVSWGYTTMESLFLYHILAYRTNNKGLQEQVSRQLCRYPVNSNRFPEDPAAVIADYGLISGYAGLGMHLLTAAGAIGPDWFNLSPIIY